MSTPQAAIYARVSSERQATAQTIASQLAALRERVTVDGYVLPEAMQFLDDGYSGTTLVRPALERLRDLVAAGAVDRLYIHSPDRLARKYAYQVLLVDEFHRAGVEVVFLNRALGRSPEDDLLLQVQGMMAEYERAKILERHRRGKLHAARAGKVNVLGGAPYGYRYIDKHAGGGQARYEVLPEEARVVCQVFDWVGRDRVTIGEVCRRLTQASERTRTGRTVWERSVVGGILHNPAYQGTAAFGKTRQGPLRPRLRAQRGRPQQPRRATADYEVPAAEWLPIPVPALVDPALFAAVQEQVQENRRHARQSRRGARYLLQGLVHCQQCGYAFYGKPISRKAAKGKTRTYAYYRCLGTDAYRFGGERVCTNAQVRTDLLDVTVWREVQGVLAHPERVAEEYQRRLQTTTAGTHQAQATLEAQLGKVRQGLARLIDSYAEGLLEKHEFEPRITRLRQRLTQLEEQRQQLIDMTALQTEIRLIVGRLEDFAAKIDAGLEDSDWLSKREMIRALVKRVEVTPDRVNVIFRVDAYPGEASPEKKSLQLRGGSNFPLLANVALDGMERLFDAEYADGRPKAPACRKGNNKGIAVIRYADDFVTTAPTREVLETYARPRIEQFLHERGLALSEAKTRIVHITEGFNFLGFHIRKFGKQGKLLTVPQKEKVLKHVRAMRAYLDAHKQTPAGQVIKALNPVIRGWAHYYRHCAAKHVFQKVRHAQWQMLWSWAKRRHPDKSRKWVKARYFRDDGYWTFWKERRNWCSPMQPRSPASPRSQGAILPMTQLCANTGRSARNST